MLPIVRVRPFSNPSAHHAATPKKFVSKAAASEALMGVTVP